MLENLSNQLYTDDEIPILAELFSMMLLISAEKNFDTISPKVKRSPAKNPFFSVEHKQAYASHEKICKLWRSAGRPTASGHPAKIAKLESQRNLQRIARDEKSMKERTNHDDLMTTFSQNASQICRKLKQIRGENLKSIDLPFIDTLNGRFSGNNVLEGFCSKHRNFVQ